MSPAVSRDRWLSALAAVPMFSACEGSVLVLSQRAFRGLLPEVPTISWRLMTGLARRVHELDAGV